MIKEHRMYSRLEWDGLEFMLSIYHRVTVYAEDTATSSMLTIKCSYYYIVKISINHLFVAFDLQLWSP